MDRLKELSGQIWDLILNPSHTTWLCPPLLLADGALTAFIVKAIPCKSMSNSMAPCTANDGILDTEIDWIAYMQQIDIYRSGERDYANIKGQTGTHLRHENYV